jgi:hypothetical protein
MFIGGDDITKLIITKTKALVVSAVMLEKLSGFFNLDRTEL